MSVAPRDLEAIRNSRVDDFDSYGRDVYAMNKSYVTHHREAKDRIRKLDLIVDGKWKVVWPDGKGTQGPANIGDAITADLEDVGKLAGGIEPFVVCDPDKDTDKAQAEASLRQQVLAAYRLHSRLGRQRRYLAMDLAGAGLACQVVLPGKLLPEYIRKDPRYVFPDPSWKGTDEVDNVTVSYRQKARIIEKGYPGTLSRLFTRYELRDASNKEVEVIEFYDADVSLKVIAHAPTAQPARTAVVYGLANETGMPMAIVGMRPSFDGQFRGQFDKAIGPMLLANEMVTMQMDQMADIIYAERIVRGSWDNAQDIGPGAILYTREPKGQAEIERAPTATPSGAFYANLQLLLEQGRIGSGVPAARTGQVDQSIISAAGVNSLHGKLNTAVEDYQDTLADMEQRSNAVALAIDEKYLDFEKTVSGVSQGRHFSQKYTPSIAINGKYDNRVVYGEGAGLDRLNREVSLINRVSNRMMPRREAMVQLNSSGDVMEWERQMAKENILDGILETLKQPAQDIAASALKLRAYELLDEGKSPYEMAAILAKEGVAAPEAPAGPEDLMGEIRAAQRALPGAEALPTTGPEAPLPPLDELIPGGAGAP